MIPTWGNLSGGSAVPGAGAAIFGTPDPATIGVSYTWVPGTRGLTAPLTFAQTGGVAPDGTTFDTSTGGFPGTPTTAQTKSGISIQVTDSSAIPKVLTLSGLSIVVSPALVLTNSPATTIGISSAYSYLPATTGGRGTVTWGIVGTPSWATWAPLTPSLTGTTPGAPETDTGITITGTDADGRVVSTGAFQIAVTNAAPAPFAPVNVVFVGDSTMAGRGSGTGTLGMDGARALAIPAQVANRLNALGITASSQSIGQAGNLLGDESGLLWENYDPRIVHNTWGSGSATAGGALTSSNVNNPLFTFTPSSSIDTFDLYVLVAGGGSGLASTSIDAGAAVSYKQTTTGTFPGLNGPINVRKLTFSAGALGGHTLNLTRTSGTASFLTMVGYNSATPDVRCLNMGIRGITTVSYATGSNPYDFIPSLTAYAAPNGITIISLGINDIASGSGVTLSAYQTALQTMVTQQLPFGEVMLMVPTPISPGSAVQFTLAQMATAVQNVATASGNLTVIDSPAILGAIYGTSPSVWDAINTAGQAFDSLHLKALPYQQLGNAIGDVIAAKVWAASTPPANNTTFLTVGGGGGGGNGFGPGGGGGGGGLSTGSFIAKSGTYTITVGASGAGGATGAASHQGAAGTDSTIVFSGQTFALGVGGGGGASGVGNGQGGGSGGGASVTGLSGIGNFGQGNSGGLSAVAAGSGGGGGAGSAGVNGAAGVGGNGGAGLNNSITGASVGYAGGGGAGGTASGSGTHGGGNGGASATAGATNKGGGGGGGLGNAVAGGNGGTGVVILRVLTTAFTPTTTGTPTITTDGLYSVYTYTASGTFVVP